MSNSQSGRPGPNKYGVYRQVRYNRTYRTLGRMTWWRVVLGVALLILVFVIAGTPSQILAERGHFRAAERALLFPGWAEKYRPELKAFIEAGVLYEEGDYAAAADAFAAQEDIDAVLTMRALSRLHLAQQRWEAGDADGARAALALTDSERLAGDDLALWQQLTEKLTP